jgi:hypothetical protein
LEITASTEDVKKMTLSWSSAFEGSGVSYEVCREDESQESNCEQITEVTDTYEASFSVNSLIETLESSYFIIATYGDEVVVSNTEVPASETITEMIGYFKASNAGDSDYYGYSVALSGDGSTLAVGAVYEDNSATGVITDGSEYYGDADDVESENSGAVYLYSNEDGYWQQVAYLKASSANDAGLLGFVIDFSDDGDLLVVSAHGESVPANWVVNEDDADSGLVDDETATMSGAVYVFSKESGSWQQDAYIKASNASSYDNFGRALAVSGDGTVIAVGAPLESNSSQGIVDLSEGEVITDDEDSEYSGAVYLYELIDDEWVETTYFKASNAESSDYFGWELALNYDGTVMATSAYSSNSSSAVYIASGTDFTDDNSMEDSGAVYVFTSSDSGWEQTAYIKPSNIEEGDLFGYAMSMSSDGTLLAVNSLREDNSATGVTDLSDGVTEISEDGFAEHSGAIYLFSYDTGEWVETAYIKASNTEEKDYFGRTLALSGDGTTLAAGAHLEDNSLAGIELGDVTEDTDTLVSTGAVYLYSNIDGSWQQRAYIKASNPESEDFFGQFVALSSDGGVLAVGAYGEDNSISGIVTDGSETEDYGTLSKVGAVYLY